MRFQLPIRAPVPCSTRLCTPPRHRLGGETLWHLNSALRLRATPHIIVMAKRCTTTHSTEVHCCELTCATDRFSADAAERELSELRAEAQQLQRDAQRQRDTVSSRMRAAEVQEAIEVLGQRHTSQCTAAAAVWRSAPDADSCWRDACGMMHVCASISSARSSSHSERCGCAVA